ncbi:MAG: shikimate kinase [Gemmatimonadales bacterium]|nr:MAG: shikimate kinase [Gemmatimonadales bacterium]
MRLVFLYGPPGVGKLTVATALEARSDFKLFHNHLTVNLLTEVFEFGSREFRLLREDIWLSVFREAAASGTNLVFTFAPERTVSTAFIAHVVETVHNNGGYVVFVELHCAENILRERMTSETRREWGKISSWSEYEELRDTGVLDYGAEIVPALSIDTGESTPEDAAAEIAEFVART